MNELSQQIMVIRPCGGGRSDRARFAYSVAFVPIVAAGVARAIGGAHSALTALLVVASLLSAVGLSLALRADFFANTSLSLTSRVIRRTGYFGRTGECRRDAVDRVVEATVVVTRLGGIPASGFSFSTLVIRPSSAHTPSTTQPRN